MFVSCLSALDVVVDHCLNSLKAGGVQINGLHASVAPRRQQERIPPTLEKYCFIPYIESNCLSSSAQLHAYLEHCKGRAGLVCFHIRGIFQLARADRNCSYYFNP